MKSQESERECILSISLLWLRAIMWGSVFIGRPISEIMNSNHMKYKRILRAILDLWEKKYVYYQENVWETVFQVRVPNQQEYRTLDKPSYCRG